MLACKQPPESCCSTLGDSEPFQTWLNAALVEEQLQWLQLAKDGLGGGRAAAWVGPMGGRLSHGLATSVVSAVAGASFVVRAIFGAL